MTLPEDSKAREQWPLYDYMFGYFPLAWLEEVRVAWVGNQQHNPGEKMHWAREKSTDHLNKAMRHIFDHATGSPKDADGTYHLAKARWRIGAALQLLVEQEKGSADQARVVLGDGHESGRGVVPQFYGWRPIGVDHQAKPAAEHDPDGLVDR